MDQWALRKKMKHNNKLLWRRVMKKKTLMVVEWMSLNTWNKLRNWFLWKSQQIWNLSPKRRIRMKMSWLAKRRTRTYLVAESVSWRMKTLITLWLLLASVRVRWESSICSVLKHGLLASESWKLRKWLQPTFGSILSASYASSLTLMRPKVRMARDYLTSLTMTHPKRFLAPSIAITSFLSQSVPTQAK